MRTRMTLAKWYSSSVAIPERSRMSYAPFLASCIGIVNSVVEDNMGKGVRVRFADVSTAQAETERRLITISQKFLAGEFGQEGRPVDSNTTISVILGVVTHEAAHFAWSPPTLRPAVEYIQNGTKCLFNQTVAATVANIVEDVYIEAEIERTVPSLHWTIETANEVLFHDAFIQQKLTEGSAVKGPPSNLVLVAAAINVMVLAKTRKSLAVNPYLAELLELASSASELYRKQQRFELSLFIYDRLMCGLESEEGEGESGEGEPSPGDGEAAVESAKELAEGITASHDGEAKFRGVPTTMDVRRANDALEKLEDARVSLLSDETPTTATPTDLYIEKRIPADEPPLEMDERYVRLAEIGRQRATVNRPYGEDRTRGTHIRKLYRIGTDSKIFAHPLAVHAFKPMQVIILVDCSGSMESGAGEIKKVRGKGVVIPPTRINLALKAALGAAYGLANAHCDVAVYGHTAETFGGTEVLIYKAKDFNDPIEGLGARLAHIEKSESLYQNRDGYAIKYVSRKFNDRKKRRLLIVISDGAPEAGFSYRGSIAQKHTTESVAEVRKQGIDVLSISITEWAAGTNDAIYGAEWNVANEDPNVIEEVVRRIVFK